ncbi:cell filamentation protein Fic [Clavibacter michiganensis]|uniref:Fic/DOC family protein n=1 Tax=Clavibacter michiganensis TaxID=28447 RepID=UPI000CE8D243|nr:Fic family protein [Clavibacter michiganensis]PPF91316.1 cell filamentation protein Fic [Clavibacter michiganensis]PPF99358.1 cell filamentation protein Fic [Clavibacter michiganensis]
MKPSQVELWAGYFYPETYDSTAMSGTLINRLGERNAQTLAAKEYVRTSQRQRELMSGQVVVPRTFDAAHVRAIHRHLFQDVYDWAGEYRTVPIFKGTPVGFADVNSGAVDRYLADVHRLVGATRWEGLGRDEFAERAATVFAYLNQAHPFREGNGRTSKVFMEHVAELSPFALEYDRASPEQWNEASKWSGPDRFGYEPHPAELLPVFRTITVARAGSGAAVPDAASRARSAVNTSYPHSAQGALRAMDASVPVAKRSGIAPAHGVGSEAERA